MSYATKQVISWTEQGLVPDSVIRSAIRRLLRARLADLSSDNVEHMTEETERFVAAM